MSFDVVVPVCIQRPKSRSFDLVAQPYDVLCGQWACDLLTRLWLDVPIDRKLFSSMGVQAVASRFPAMGNYLHTSHRNDAVSVDWLNVQVTCLGVSWQPYCTSGWICIPSRQSDSPSFISLDSAEPELKIATHGAGIGSTRAISCLDSYPRT